MINILAKMVGKRIVHRVVAGQKVGGLLDMKFGFALLRDGRVPIQYKLIALGIGGALTAALLAMELPVEAILAALVVGLPFDLALDGLETMVGPVLIGILLLPHLAPKAVTDRIRTEREGRVIDVEGRDPKPTSGMHFAR